MTVHTEHRITRTIHSAHAGARRWTWWIIWRHGTAEQWHSGTARTRLGAWWACRRALRALGVGA